jgi:signal transduction histidine kinase
MLQLAQIVHDLKTPLNCIKLTTQMFSMGAGQDREIQQQMKQMKIQFEFIFSMIEDIQDLAKFNNNQKFTLNKEYFNVTKLAKEMVQIFED